MYVFLSLSRAIDSESLQKISDLLTEEVVTESVLVTYALNLPPTPQVRTYILFQARDTVRGGKGERRIISRV